MLEGGSRQAVSTFEISHMLQLQAIRQHSTSSLRQKSKNFENSISDVGQHLLVGVAMVCLRRKRLEIVEYINAWSKCATKKKVQKQIGF